MSAFNLVNHQLTPLTILGDKASMTLVDEGPPAASNPSVPPSPNGLDDTLSGQTL